MSDVPETHTCPWCESQRWELKTTDPSEGPRMRCVNCNAGFLLGDLPEALNRNTKVTA
jgi:hypothetical protein